jgi:nucleoside-diphosphate-sugar epimerase
MQTILGANGIISTKLAKNLTKYTRKIRLVSRNPQKVNADDELFSADLLKPGEVLDAVNGSDVVYLTAGLKYEIKVWQEQWHIIMRNVLDACKKFNSKLVFFDNVYLYGKVNRAMTEETPVNPSSKKGEVRAKIAQMLFDEVNNGNLKALIARAPDFYGPRNNNSVANMLVFDNFRKGARAQWLINDNVKHSFIYTPDAGKGTAMLGNTESAYNQIWHLPTSKNPLTGKEFIVLAAKEFGVEPKYTVLSKWMLRIAGMFNGDISESIEMLYQNDSDYIFDSSKFETEFAFTPTSYEEGIKETVKSMSEKNK